jgi:hypothetical protein
MVVAVVPSHSTNFVNVENIVVVVIGVNCIIEAIVVVVS